MTTDEQLARGWFKEGVETFLKDKHAATFNTPDYYYASGYLRAKQEARIAALSKDAERLKFFNQVWRWKALKDGEIIYQYGEHVPSLFQKTAELLPTHPPAPKAITADMVTDEMVEMFEGASPDELGWWGDSDRDDIIAAAVNAFNGVKP